MNPSIGQAWICPAPTSKREITLSPAIPTSRVVCFIALATSGAIADLWTKSAIFKWRGLPGESDPFWVIDGVLGIETAVNIGAVFGLGAGKGLFFAAFSVIAAIAILVWLFYFRAAQSLWLTVALGMITGGIIGNLYDRLGMWWIDGYPAQWQSGVRDWILFQIDGVPGLSPWPNFNIADSLLVVGAGMLMYQSFFPGSDPSEETGTESDSTSQNNDRLHDAPT
ncbi:Lipoprotein signal peptidase [Rubripirellula tenax]|uniref:Lipoprotein signal peptidase n=1 Tax=Rubripirellula tenax TaxID=2528015 RepID=A0A5C6FFA1_9BACT|nr:signal peptidase II [Rubripirellula tenax]TWU59422.1 Lipoprotein signal peptidase [Rubripirellula tenax]